MELLMDNILNFPNGDRETREVKRIKKQRKDLNKQTKKIKEQAELILKGEQNVSNVTRPCS